MDPVRKRESDDPLDRFEPLTGWKHRDINKCTVCDPSHMTDNPLPTSGGPTQPECRPGVVPDHSDAECTINQRQSHRSTRSWDNNRYGPEGRRGRLYRNSSLKANSSVVVLVYRVNCVPPFSSQIRPTTPHSPCSFPDHGPKRRRLENGGDQEYPVPSVH